MDRDVTMKRTLAELLKDGGPERDRTAGLLVANEALSQRFPVLNQSLPFCFATNNPKTLERKWNVRMLEFASRAQHTRKPTQFSPMWVSKSGGGTHAA